MYVPVGIHAWLASILLLVPVVCLAQDLSVLSPSSSSTLAINRIADAGTAVTTGSIGLVPICHPHRHDPAVAQPQPLPGFGGTTNPENVVTLTDCRTAACGQVVSTHTPTWEPRHALPTPALIPTEHDFCPEYATLDEAPFGAHHRVYRCTREDGVVLWQKTWCGEVPRETAAIAAPQCTGQGSSAALLGLPHFHCDLQTLTWRLHCRDTTGQLVWDVPL